jgi:hypothetical protein
MKLRHSLLDTLDTFGNWVVVKLRPAERFCFEGQAPRWQRRAVMILCSSLTLPLAIIHYILEDVGEMSEAFRMNWEEIK